MQTKKYITKSNWEKLISKFIPYEGFEATDYYGVSMIKAKKSGYYRIKLIYDYTSRALLSKNEIEIPSKEKAIQIYDILDSFSRDSEIVYIDDFDFLEDKNNKDTEKW